MSACVQSNRNISYFIICADDSIDVTDSDEISGSRDDQTAHDSKNTDAGAFVQEPWKFDSNEFVSESDNDSELEDDNIGAAIGITIDASIDDLGEGLNSAIDLPEVTTESYDEDPEVSCVQHTPMFSSRCLTKMLAFFLE